MASRNERTKVALVQGPLATIVSLLAGLVLTAPLGSQQATTIAVDKLGSFEFIVSPNGMLIAAPHGTADRNTDAAASLAARELGAGYLIARGFEPHEPIWRLGRSTRINVNRPTEARLSGEGPVTCEKEAPTARARRVYAEYERLVRIAAGGAPPRLYVEVHGNNYPETSRRIEVATKGLSSTQVQSVKAAYPQLLEQARTNWPAYPPLELGVEPADRIYWGSDRNWGAGCNVRGGIIGTPLVPRVLHFEFPSYSALRNQNLLAGSARIVTEIVRRVER